MPHIVHINNNNNGAIIFSGVLLHSQIKPRNDGQTHRVSPNKASVNSVHANPDHSTDTDNLWSGFLDVTFDLGVNDWDDFDDGNLVDASEVCYESKICNLMTDHDQPTNYGLLDSFYSLFVCQIFVKIVENCCKSVKFEMLKLPCCFLLLFLFWLQPHNVSPNL